MQAANTVRGGGISRSVIGFVGALLAAMLLGGAGGFLAKSMSAGPAVTPDSRPVVTHYQSAPAGVGV